MSAQLRQPHLNVDMETIVQTAVTRGYTAQGEMFSGNFRVSSGGLRHFRRSWLLFLPAENMALLAEEVCGCKAQLLSGGLSGNNAAAIITHLWEKQPVLIPYPSCKKEC